MASPENQGLQIALIACAFLVVLLGSRHVLVSQHDRRRDAQGGERRERSQGGERRRGKNHERNDRIEKVDGLCRAGRSIDDRRPTSKRTWRPMPRRCASRSRTIATSSANWRPNFKSKPSRSSTPRPATRICKPTSRPRKRRMLAEIEQYKTGLKQAKDDLEQERTKLHRRSR